MNAAFLMDKNTQCCKRKHVHSSFFINVSRISFRCAYILCTNIMVGLCRKFAMFILFLFISFAKADMCEPYAGSMLIQVADYLSGSFTTEWQAHTYAGSPYLRTKRERIWPERADGIWLFVQYTDSINQTVPSKVRVLRLQNKAYGVSGKEYTLRNGGVIPKPNLLDEIPYCDMLITRVDGHSFKGAISPGGCKDDRKGAEFVMVEYVLNEWRVLETRRGFNKDGTLLWGSSRPIEHVHINGN